MFVLREALRSIKRMPGTFVVSVLALGIAVGLAGFLANAAYQAHQRLQEARGNLKIEAFFDPAISSESATQIANTQVAALAPVKHIEITSKEQALADFAKSTGENVREVLGMNPLPASVQVYLKQPTAENAERMKGTLEKIDGVVNVRTDIALVKTLESRTALLETLAAIFGGLCLLATVFFLVLASRFSLALRAQTETVFERLGATRRQSRFPLTIEALCSGVLGGVLATALLVTLQHTVLDRLGAEIVVASGLRGIATLGATCVIVAALLALVSTRIARLTTRFPK
jgi:cell division transport system permease protein